MMNGKKGVRLASLFLALALIAGGLVSCQFPFELDLNGSGSEQPSGAGASVGTEGTGAPSSSQMPTESPAGEQPSGGLDFVQQTQAQGTAESEAETLIPETENATGAVYDVSGIVDAVMPAMVAITVRVTNVQSGIFGGAYEYETEGAGSGIIVAQDESFLYIVTNNHVVEDSTKISVSFVDGEEYKAVVKGSDASHDLAVLLVKIGEMKEKTLADIRVAKIGNSEELRLGEGAVAIGNALGYGQSVTVGCISALGRTVKSDDGASIPLVQTDAAINPGNSGGALLNMKGEVIGINSMKYASTEVEGMGYAIPISDALPIMQKLIDEKFYDENERGYLGVSCTALPQGLYIVSVAENSPASKAGLKKGDIMISANGKTMKTSEDLSNVLSRLTAGDELAIAYLRQVSSSAYEQKQTTAILSLRDASQN